MAQLRVQWLALANMVIKLHVSQKAVTTDYCMSCCVQLVQCSILAAVPHNSTILYHKTMK